MAEFRKEVDAGVMERRFWRQMDIIKPEELPPVTVVGVGGIGSFVALALAKMGVLDITVFDDDKVEEHNVPNQLYGNRHLGMFKVDAAVEVCQDLADISIVPKAMKLGDERLDGIVISGVDSMASRKDIWSKLKFKPSVRLYIDARMGAEVSRIFTVNPCDPEGIAFYEGSLYSDEEAYEDPCTAKAVIYNGFAIAALVASQVKKFSKGEEGLKKEIIFDLKSLTLMAE